MKEIRVCLNVTNFGDGDIDTLKRFLYTNSGVRRDGYKLISMHQDSEKSIDMELCAPSLDLLQEYADENKASMNVKCIYTDDRSIEYSIVAR